MQKRDLRSMEITRRDFGKTATGVLFSVLAGFTLRTLRMIASAKSAVFPGKTKPLDDREISRPSRWTG